MYLLIHSPNRDTTYVALAKSEGIFDTENYSAQANANMDLMIDIDAILKRNNATPQNLKGIIVMSGPGSFAALRSGIVIANTTGQVLNIPVAGVGGNETYVAEELFAEGMKVLGGMKEFVPVIPAYGREANVSTPKKV